MKDLLQLYQIYSVSETAGEKKIADWLQARIKELGVEVVRIDNTLYHFEKGNKVMLSAHLDQVATNGPAKYLYQEEDSTIKAYNKNWQRTSLGADDKNGVWIILKMLEAGHKFDFIISECEEIGGYGIAKVEPLLDTSTAEYCLVLDRKGNTDILNKGGATTYCESLAYNLKNFWQSGFSVVTGGMSDTQTICKYKESINMSVAYDHPHTANETTNFNRLQEIAKCVERVVAGEFVHYAAKPDDYKDTTTYKSYQRYSKWEDLYA